MVTREFEDYMQGKAAPDFGKNDVEILETVNCYKGFLRIDKVRLKCRLFEGGWSEEFHREVLLRAPGVGVLLYDPRLDKVLLVEQFRIGCVEDERNGPWALELVAGLLEPGRNPDEVAIRENHRRSWGRFQTPVPICEFLHHSREQAQKIDRFCAGFRVGESGWPFGLGRNRKFRTGVYPGPNIGAFARGVYIGRLLA